MNKEIEKVWEIVDKIILWEEDIIIEEIDPDQGRKTSLTEEIDNNGIDQGSIIIWIHHLGEIIEILEIPANKDQDQFQDQGSQVAIFLSF